MTGNWERRWHPLLQQWVVIAANSAKRPWSGMVTTDHGETQPAHDEDCYLCPRVTRANGAQNPDYEDVYAIDNDFPALAAHAPACASTTDPLHSRAAATGRCRVLVWSPRHDLTLANLTPAQMFRVAKLWQSEITMLEQVPDVKQVLIFENKGVETGASNLHPHGQVYATPFVSDNAQRMRAAQADYTRETNGEDLLNGLLHHAGYRKDLLVEESQHCSVIVPYAARFSYETWLVPHRAVSGLDEYSDDELHDIALTYQRQAKRYDVLFQRPAPNITLLHNAPCDDHADNRYWHFHIAMQPPLRDPEKLKYLAGAEAGMNNIINPVQPEQAAKMLRECVL